MWARHAWSHQSFSGECFSQAISLASCHAACKHMPSSLPKNFQEPWCVAARSTLFQFKVQSARVDRSDAVLLCRWDQYSKYCDHHKQHHWVILTKKSWHVDLLVRYAQKCNSYLWADDKGLGCSRTCANQEKSYPEPTYLLHMNTSVSASWGSPKLYSCYMLAHVVCAWPASH